MKYVIAVDCEGAACVVGTPGRTLSQAGEHYDFARRQATSEANAAARGLFSAGAEQVIVWDNHGEGLNLLYEALDDRCDIFCGVSGQRFPMLDSSFSGVLFVGYHARDNVVAAPLAHTYSSVKYQWIKVNGQEVGELAIDSAVAGTYGVPPIFVASDDKAVAEALDFFPGITTVQTKVGYGWNAALSKHPHRILQEIESATRKAAENRVNMKPFQFKEPLEFEVRHKRIETADEACRVSSGGWHRVDAYTLKRTLSSLGEFF